MFEIVEYASIILMSSWNTAKSAPMTIDIAPSHVSMRFRPLRSIAPEPYAIWYTRSMPRMPTFTTSPDSTAETGLGAMACASGSQICRGKSAAFTMKPRVSAANAITRGAAGAPARRLVTSAMFSDPVSA